MSNNVVLDFGVDIGNDKTENTYMKLRMGRGKQEVATLRQEVEAGSGVTLDDSKHYVSFNFPETADTATMIEMIDGMTPGQGSITENSTGKSGKWVMCSITDAIGDGEEAGMLTSVDAGITEFFSQVESNAFVEFGIRSAHSFEQALEVAKANNEATCEKGNTDNLISIAGFGENMNCHLKMDVDHEFAIDMLKFAKKQMGLPISTELYDFVRKFNMMEIRLDGNGPECMTEGVRAEMTEVMWSYLGQNRDMASELTAFKTLTNEMKIIFLLRDDVYLQFEMKLPGLQSYIEYFAQEE